MAATKTSASLLSAVTTTQTSSAVDTSAHYADSVYVKIVVVGSPSAGASFAILQSPDAGTTYYTGPTYTASTTAGTYYWIIQLDPTCTKVEISFTAQTGGTSSTCTAQLGELTGV